MKLIYNGADVLEEVKPLSCLMRDKAGGEADTLEAVFADPAGRWASWKPRRGDSFSLEDGSFRSGVLYVDDLEPMPGKFQIFAVSVPLEARKPQTRIWREAALSEIAGDVAGRCGLTLQTYGVEDWSYRALSQHQETDIAFLARLCRREGYAVKVADGVLLLYGEKEMEGQAPAVTVLQREARPGYSFRRGTGLLSQVRVAFAPFRGSAIEQTAQDPAVTGGTAVYREYCVDDGEARRFAFGYLRAANKSAQTAVLPLLHRTDLAAGSTVALSGFGGEEDGTWFVQQVDREAVADQTTLYLRKPLDY